jgi:hypothetical protein
MLRTSVLKSRGIEVTRLETDDTYALGFDKLAAAADPANWPRCLPRHFLRMIDLGTDEAGWHRMIEHVAYGMFKIRTPLKFWKSATADSYHIEYDLDPHFDPRRVDRNITADNGFIQVRRAGINKVNVKTRKDLAIMGTIPRLTAWMAPWMGYNAMSQDFFTNQAYILNPKPFIKSEA